MGEMKGPFFEEMGVPAEQGGVEKDISPNIIEQVGQTGPIEKEEPGIPLIQGGVEAYIHKPLVMQLSGSDPKEEGMGIPAKQGGIEGKISPKILAQASGHGAKLEPQISQSAIAEDIINHINNEGVSQNIIDQIDMETDAGKQEMQALYDMIMTNYKYLNQNGLRFVEKNLDRLPFTDDEKTSLSIFIQSKIRSGA